MRSLVQTLVPPKKALFGRAGELQLSGRVSIYPSVSPEKEGKRKKGTQKERKRNIELLTRRDSTRL
jgi:hypothetical protein